MVPTHVEFFECEHPYFYVNIINQIRAILKW